MSAVMNIANVIAYRYPQAILDADYSVGDLSDGTGQYIEFWNEPKLGAEPTTEQLRSWWLDSEIRDKLREIALAADKDYERLLAPDTVLSRVERDETLEKKAANRITPGVAPLLGAEQIMAARIDELRAKYATKKQSTKQISQQSGETVEQAVERVRAIAW